MLDEKTTFKICEYATNALNLKAACEQIAVLTHHGDTAGASKVLEEAISKSCAACILAVMKEYEKQK